MKNKKFKTIVESVMKFLNDNYHPHTKIIIESDKAELVEGIECHTTDKYINDNKKVMKKEEFNILINKYDDAWQTSVNPIIGRNIHTSTAFEKLEKELYPIIDNNNFPFKPESLHRNSIIKWYRNNRDKIEDFLISGAVSKKIN